MTDKEFVESRYIARIKNPAKKTYAAKYWHFLQGMADQPEPTGLGVMAAQAVRMNLNHFARA